MQDIRPALHLMVYIFLTLSSAMPTRTLDQRGSGCQQINFVAANTNVPASHVPDSTCVPGGIATNWPIGSPQGTLIEINAMADGGKVTENGDDYNILDVSVCAGYTVPVKCSISGTASSDFGTVAGGLDAFAPCPDGNGATLAKDGACINLNKADPSNDVNAAFRHDKYWYWNHFAQQVQYVGWQTITCKIGSNS